MTDPTVPIATAASAGLGAMILAELGLPPSLLALAFFAACFGLLFARKGKSRWHDLAVFVCVVVGAAQLGTSFAPVLAAYAPLIKAPDRVLVVVIGILFHPVFNLLAARLPSLADKIGIKATDKGAKP
jgi:hypothetical protein